MTPSGWILTLALALWPARGRAADDPFRAWLETPARPSCEAELSFPEATRAMAAAVAGISLPRALGHHYADASFVELHSPFAQAVHRAKFSTDASIVAMSDRGLSLELSGEDTELVLFDHHREIHRWTLAEPLAEVRFAAAANRRDGEFALIGWVRARYYHLRDGRLIEVAAPAPHLAPRPSHLAVTPPVLSSLGVRFDRARLSDRDYREELLAHLDQADVRVSPWIPNRDGRDASEDVARLAALARRPEPPSRLTEALGELVAQVVRTARAICDREAIPGGLINPVYPNQLLALAADALVTDPALRDIVTMTTKERAGYAPLRRTALRPSADAEDGQDVFEIILPHCEPLIFSVLAHPYEDVRGWGLLRTR